MTRLSLGYIKDRTRIKQPKLNLVTANITLREELPSSPKGYIKDETRIKQPKLNLVTIGRDSSFLSGPKSPKNSHYTQKSLSMAPRILKSNHRRTKLFRKHSPWHPT